MTQNRRTIAITGSIGSGKSTVANILRELGEKVISCDEKTAQSYCLAKKELSLAFPFCISEDGVNRKALAKMVFSDDVSREKLNAILHPVIMRLVREEIEKCEGLVFIEVPLLFEAHLENEFDVVWLVYSSEKSNRARIVLRDKLTIEDADKRLSKQLSNDIKIKNSHTIINNEGDLASLEIAVRRELQNLKNS